MKSFFDEIQLDLLKEYINISFGSATASIAILLDSFATLNIPSIEVIKAVELEKYINEKISIEKSKYIAQQIFNGELKGETVFIADGTSVSNLAKHLFKDMELNESYINDSILELNNILSVTTIGKLSEISHLSSKFLPPTLKVIEGNSFLEKKEIEKYPNVIVISTDMVFENEKIRGYLFILTTDEMIIKLKEVIIEQIKEQIPDYEV